MTSPPPHVTIDEIVVERSPADTPDVLAAALARTLAAAGVERSELIARAVVEKLDARGVLR